MESFVSYVGLLPKELIIALMQWLSSKTRSITCSVSRLFSQCAVECSAGIYPGHLELYYNPPTLNLSIIRSIVFSGDYHLIVRLRDPRFIDMDLACLYGHMDMVQLMIERGAPNIDWNSGLCNACEGGHMDIVWLMIEHGAVFWNSGLWRACRHGHIRIVKLMIEHGANDWNEGLRNACQGGHMDIVKLMIERGANDWNYGLYGACEGGHMDVIKLMIEHGASKCSNCDKSVNDH